MHVVFACPACDQPARLDASIPSDWQCAHCEHRQHVPACDPALPSCCVCGCHELYRKKDFPHTLGMTILIAAFAASVVTYARYEPWLTWTILIGTAAFDIALYCFVGDAFVCYRCQAHFKGFPKTVPHGPFELTTGERYRQELLRKQRSCGAPANPPPPGA